MNSQDSGIHNEHFCGGTPDDEKPAITDDAIISKLQQAIELVRSGDHGVAQQHIDHALCMVEDLIAAQQRHDDRE